jgi:Na+/melibiose symporter-like transporter
MTYNLGRASEISFVLGALLISQVACVPLAAWFAKKTSKTHAIVLGNIGWTISAAASFLINSDSPVYYIYVLACILGSFISFSLVGYNAIFGDVTEVGEYHLGYRAEGNIYGIQQFIRKCAAAVANWFALFLLGFSGFVTPVEVVENGVTTFVTQPQAPIVLFTIRSILGIVSIVLLIPSTITALRWKLTKDKHAKLIGYLDRKRAGIEIDPELEQEVCEICKPLI